MAAAGGAVAGLVLSPRLAFADTVPTIAYDSVPDPLRLPPDIYFGECLRRRAEFEGHVFALSRGEHDRAGLWRRGGAAARIRTDGRFLREIGHNLYAWSFAHTVKVDRHDNIWVTDKGSDMVIKFTPDGRVEMVFGRKQEASDEETGPLKHPNPPLPAEHGKFRQVTDVAWDAAGNTYISDGYINSRVAKVDKDGNWLKSWGDRGAGPGQFHTPHSIAVDANRPSLCRRPQQPAHSGVRRRRQFPAAVHHRRSRAPRRAAGDRQQAGRGGDRRRHIRARLAVGDLHLARTETRFSTAPTPFPAASTS